MSTPRDHLPVYVQFDIERYLSYGWKPSLILSMIYRRHAYRIVHNCVEALQNGTSCPGKCEDHCWIKRVARPVPKAEWLEELRRKAAPGLSWETYRR
ncbi:MAG: hypothetical protein Q4E38_07870 [Eubacteriales bacterium]|nr:hypothetical protein [Eubacteriales bacterium]